MKTTFLSSLLLVALLSIGTHAFAHDFVVGGIYYEITSSTDKTVAELIKVLIMNIIMNIQEM